MSATAEFLRLSDATALLVNGKGVLTAGHSRGIATLPNAISANEHEAQSDYGTVAKPHAGNDSQGDGIIAQRIQQRRQELGTPIAGSQLEAWPAIGLTRIYGLNPRKPERRNESNL